MAPAAAETRRSADSNIVAAYSAASSGNNQRAALVAFRAVGYGVCSVSRRRVARRARIEQTSTLETSTSAPAHAWRCQSAYGDMASGETLTVNGAVGWSKCVVKRRLLSAVNNVGAVPAAIRA